MKSLTIFEEYSDSSVLVNFTFDMDPSSEHPMNTAMIVRASTGVLRVLLSLEALGDVFFEGSELTEQSDLAATIHPRNTYKL